MSISGETVPSFPLKAFMQRGLSPVLRAIRKRKVSSFLPSALKKGWKSKGRKSRVPAADEIRIAGWDAFHPVGENWLKPDNVKPIAVLFGFPPWKRNVTAKFFPDYRIAFARKNTSWRKQQAALARNMPALFVFWGMQGRKSALSYAERHNIPIWRVEDGFLRSVGLGASHVEPLSCAVDRKGIYFDSSKASDLEDLIAGFDSSQNQQTLSRARNCIDLMLEHRLTKYNVLANVKLKELPPSNRRRVLVIGQVEDDASIIFGSKKRYTNNDIVQIAHEENVDAEIIYKPHPDVAAGHRNALSDPNDVAGIATIIHGDYDLQSLLDAVDHVYTITSLFGFEALLRGKKVSVFGEPFYSGWGITDDRDSHGRRTARRTVEEVFAAAYVTYPIYSVGSLGTDAQIEHAILALILEKHGIPRALAESIATHFDYRCISRHLCERLLSTLQQNPYLLDETALFADDESGLLDLLTDPALDSGKVVDYLLDRALEGSNNKDVFWKLRSIAQMGEPSQNLVRLKDIDPSNFALEEAGDVVACLTLIGKFDEAEALLNKKTAILPNDLRASDFLLLLQAYDWIRSEQGRFGRKPVDPQPLWKFFRDNLHWVRHDPQFIAILPKIYDHLSHFRMMEEIRWLSFEIVDALKAEDVGKLASLSNVIVAALFRASKRPELTVQRKRQLGVNIYRSIEAKVRLHFEDRGVPVPRIIGLYLLQMAIVTEDRNGIATFRDSALKGKAAITKSELPEYKKTVSAYSNMLVRARSYREARSFLSTQKDKLPEEFYLHLVSNCYTHEQDYTNAAKISLSLLKKYKKNSYRRKIATIYANRGDLDRASTWLQRASAVALEATGAPSKRELAAIRDELSRVNFLLQGSQILAQVTQPRLPRGVVFLGSFGCLNTVAMVVPLLLEMKRRGYAVIQLDEGMLRNEPTGIPWIDQHAGMIERVIHTDLDIFSGLSNVWRIDWARREVVADGINFYQAIFEIMTQKFRAFDFDINDPWIFKWFRYYLIRCDKALTACKSIRTEVMDRGMPVRFINSGSHSAPFSVYRSFALQHVDNYDIGFVHMGPAYENYYSNLKSKVATTVSLDNLTKYPLYRLPFLARPDRFEEWLKQDGLYERYKEDIGKFLNHNRVGRLDSNTSHTQYEEVLIRAKQEGRKVIGVYGKILCDMAVPFDGGPGHENIADWLRHTVSIASSTKNLIVLKPHPHELRPEIARDLNEYWLDLINDIDIPDNVVILPHTGFNNQDLIPYLDLAVLWNGTSSLELCAQGVPVVMASHFGRHDYPIELIYPESRADYERIIRSTDWQQPDRQKMERAALLLKYMGTEEVCVPFKYSHRPVTNDPVGVPYWHMDEIEKFLRDGDPHISKLADKVFDD